MAPSERSNDAYARVYDPVSDSTPAFTAASTAGAGCQNRHPMSSGTGSLTCAPRSTPLSPSIATLTCCSSHGAGPVLPVLPAVPPVVLSVLDTGGGGSVISVRGSAFPVHGWPGGADGGLKRGAGVRASDV